MRFFSNDKDSTEQSNVDVQNRAASDNPDRTDDTRTGESAGHDDQTNQDQVGYDQPVAGRRGDLPPDQRDDLPADQSTGDRSADDADRAQSDPVPVPTQRMGSPWSNAPGTADDTADAELSDRERADGTDEPGDDGIDQRSGDRPFGGEAGPGTGAGAMAASGTGAAEHDGDHDAHDLGGGRVGDRAESSGGTATTYGPDGTVSTSDDAARGDVPRSDAALIGGDRTDEDRTDGDRADHDGTGPDDRSDSVDRRDDAADHAVSDRTDDRIDEDRTDEGRTDEDRTGTVDRTDVADRGDDDADRAEGDRADGQTDTDHATATGDTEAAAAGAAAGTAAAAGAAGRAGTTGATGTGDDRDTNAADTGTTAGTGTISRPGSATAPELGPLFDAAEGQSLRERWRDVQLKFVDSPKEAATEAAGVVDDAVNKLTSRLHGHKDAVSHESDDTEQLRVAFRAYRDILDRILGL